jgi:hypothetical protein
MITKMIINLLFRINRDEVEVWIDEYNNANEMIHVSEAYDYVSDNYDPGI